MCAVDIAPCERPQGALLAALCLLAGACGQQINELGVPAGSQQVIGEQRVLSALGEQWRVADRKEDPRIGLTLVLERQVENVPGRLSLRIKPDEDHRKRPGLHLTGGLSTECVPPTVG